MPRLQPSSLTRAVWALSALLSSAPVLAQTAAASAVPAAPSAVDDSDAVRTLDTVTVTGERIHRSLRETASSVYTLDAEDIDNNPRRATVQDALAEVPNVVMPGTVTAPIIRGQDTQGPNFGAGAFLGGTVPRATINVDGRYLGYNELVFGSASIWDVDSVEVFRGPQTVSQGANSIAGAVVVNTKDPTPYMEGSAQLLGGSDRMRRASAVVSGPLAGHQLTARLALDGTSRDTFIRYVNPAFAKGETDQNFDALNARIKLLWQPDALRGLKAKLTLAHGNESRPTTEAASPPYGDYLSRTLSMPSFKQWSNSAVADVSYTFDNGVQLLNRTDFANLNVRRVAEPFFTNGGANVQQESVSNETRLSFGDARSAWRGTAGLFVNYLRSHDVLHIRGTSDFQDRKNGLGLFGEISRRLGDRWLLGMGMRYQRDRVRRHGSTPFARGAMDYDQQFSAVLPKLSLAYDINADVTVGALVSKGYNPGGVGVSFAQARAYAFDEESVRNYELFGRASLLDQRLQLTGNLFFNEFHGSQRLLPDYLNGRLYGAVVVNADRARAWGLEAAADYQASKTLRLRAGVGLLRTRITRFDAPNGDVLQGREFSRAPHRMFNFSAEWMPAQDWRLGLDARYTGSYHSADDNLPAYRVSGFTLLNARASYRLGRHVELFGYVNNLLDKAVPAWMHDDRSAGGIVSSMLAPRQFGVGVQAVF